MSFLIRGYDNRTKDYSIPIYDADGELIELAGDDVIRVKIGRGSQTILGIKSTEATENGSSVTIENPCTLRLAQGDMAAMAPGAYDCDLMVVDKSETGPQNAAKHVESGVVFVHGTLGGKVGIAESGDESGD